jgi:hypothetical protein
MEPRWQRSWETPSRFHADCAGDHRAAAGEVLIENVFAEGLGADHRPCVQEHVRGVATDDRVRLRDRGKRRRRLDADRSAPPHRIAASGDGAVPQLERDEQIAEPLAELIFCRAEGVVAADLDMDAVLGHFALVSRFPSW